MLQSRLQFNFACKNVVNSSKQNFTDSEIFSYVKGLNFLPTSNTLKKAISNTLKKA